MTEHDFVLFSRSDSDPCFRQILFYVAVVTWLTLFILIKSLQSICVWDYK